VGKKRATDARRRQTAEDGRQKAGQSTVSGPREASNYDGEKEALVSRKGGPRKLNLGRIKNTIG